MHWPGLAAVMSLMHHEAARTIHWQPSPALTELVGCAGSSAGVRDRRHHRAVVLCSAGKHTIMPRPCLLIIPLPHQPAMCCCSIPAAWLDYFKVVDGHTPMGSWMKRGYA